MATNTYGSALTLADQVAPVSYDDLKNQINANNSYTSQYQTPTGLNSLTSSYLSAMQPTWDSTKNTINQQYDNSAKNGQAAMANMGLDRSGANYDNMQTNDQNRNNAIGSAYGDLTNTAQTNALNAANLGLSEQSLVNNQNNAKVSQLSDLLNQYNTSQQQNQQNQYTEAGLTGTYNGNQTLAAQQQATADAQNLASLTGQIQTGTNANGTPIYSSTLGAQSLASDNANAKDQLAAAIMASYAQGTDNFTLPSSITTLLNNLFKTGQ